MANLRVSHSKIRTWRRCHNKYRYKYVEKLAKKKTALPLLRGRMIGECLDLVTWRRTKHDGRHWTDVLAKYATEYRIMFIEEREIYGDLVGDVADIIKRYERLYQDDGLTYLPGPDSHKPYEIKVELELMPGVDFIGYIDKLPQDRHGRVFVMDHKSHKILPDEETRFADLQLVYYVWACQQIPELPNPDGVVWDYLRTKPPAIPEVLKAGGLTKRKNIDTTYEVYHQAIVDNKLDPKDYQDILEPLKARGYHDFYRRVTLPAPPKEMVRQVVNDTKVSAQEIVHLGGISNARTMDRTCKICEYYLLCHAELRGLDADFIRKSEYTIKESHHDEKEVIESSED